MKGEEWNEEGRGNGVRNLVRRGGGEFREGDNNSGPNGGMLKIVCFLLGGRGKRYVRGGGGRSSHLFGQVEFF